jgi:hypothetical protein
MYREKSRYTNVQKENQINKRTERKSDIQTYRKKIRYTKVQREKQIYRRTKRQTDVRRT